MKRVLTAALATTMLLVTAGCDGSSRPNAIRELQQQNAALQNNLTSAGAISATLGVMVVIIGCALAVSLYVNMRDANRKDGK